MRRKGTAWRWTAKDSSTSDRTRSANTIRRPANLSAKCLARRRGRRARRRRCAAPTAAHVPGRGSAGPVAGFLTPPGGRGQPDPAARAAREAAIAAFRAKYPPTTPMIVGGIEEIRLDEPAHELYAADNYLGGRVMVFDLDTFKFKRGWGAYGHALSEMTTNDAGPRLYSRRADAQGVPRPPHAEHIQRRVGLRRGSHGEPHRCHHQGKASS